MVPKNKEKIEEGAEGVVVEKEMIQVPKEDFDRVLSQLERLSKDRDTLFKVADKGRLAHENNKEGGSLIKQVKVWTWPDNGLCIIGWTNMKVNRSELMPGTNRWIEEQTTNIILEDGQIIADIAYIDFIRKPIKVSADLVKTSTESDPKTGLDIVMFTVEFPNGKTLQLENKFVN